MSVAKDLVENVEIDYNGSRYKDDAYVLYATWIETGKALTDDELDALDIDECLEMVR